MLEVGSVFGPYRLTAVLGRGGMGIVYEATQLSLDRVVALKVVAPGLSADQGFRARFRREGPMQARIDHPHIVPVYEAGELEGHLFIAMRLVRGPTLKGLITARELDPRRSLRILRDVADALDTAHESGLIHRDIKPSNVLVGRRDHAFLCDFGLTKEGGSVTASLTKTGHVVGTLDYIAPEQIRGGEASTASDVYALRRRALRDADGPGAVPALDRDRAAVRPHQRPGAERQRSAARPAGGAGRGDRGRAREVPGRAPKSPLDLVERAEEILAGTTAGVPTLPARGRRSSLTVADTPPVPPAPPPAAFESTVADHPAAIPAASTETDVELAPAAFAGSTETDVDLPAPAPAASTETDVEFMAPPPEPPAATASTETLVPTPEPVRPTVTDTKVATPEPAVTPRTVSSPTLPLEPVDERPSFARRRVVAVGALVVVVAAGAAGALMGGKGEDFVPPGKTELAAGAAAVAVPDAWQPTPQGPVIPGLTFAEPASSAGIQGEFVVGRLPEAGGRLLLTDEFRGGIARRAGAGGRRPARRRRGLPLRRSAAARASIARCGSTSPRRIAGSSPSHACPRRPRSSPPARRRPERCSWTGRRRTRSARTRRSAISSTPLWPRSLMQRPPLERKLAGAKTRRDQSKAAAAIATVYGDARGKLDPLPNNPTVSAAAAEVEAALEAGERAYGALAKAAAGGKARAYAAAAQTVTAADARLTSSLDALKPLGYEAGEGT